MAPPLVRRELRHRPGRLAYLVATVAVAVAFTTAAFGFADQVSLQLDPDDAGLGTLTLPAGTVVVTPRTTGLTTATSIDEELLATIRDVPGVLAANGIYDQPVSFAVSAREQPERPVQLRGLVLSSTWDPARWSLLAGRAPASPDEVAVDAGGAVVGRAPLGASTRLELPTGTRRVDVVGLVTPIAAAASDSPGPRAVEEVALASAHVVLPAAHAPELLGATGKVDRVSVVPTAGTDPTELADRLRGELPAGVDVLALTDRAQATQQTVAGLDSGVRTAVTAFSLLTVLVATLAVANVHTVIVAQRTRELGLLRLVGARRVQLMRLVTGEAVLVGGLGAALGLGAGTVLAWLAVAAVQPVGVAAHLAVRPSMVLAAVVVGLVVTLLGAAWPAIRAARAVPLDAISDTRAGGEQQGRWWVGAALAAVGAALVAASVLGGGGLDAFQLAVGGVGLIGGLAGLALLSRWVVVPLASVLGRPVVAAGGVTARLGLGNVSRQPSRTAAAASTLMVTLALVAVVGTFGASARQSVDDQFRNAGRADLYLERRGLVRIDTRSLFDRMGDVFPQISDGAEVVATEGVLVGPEGVERQVVTSGLGRIARMIDLDVAEGDPRTGGGPSDGRTGGGRRDGGNRDTRAGDGAPDGAMLSVGTAERLGVGVGDELTLRSTSGQETTVQVVATYRNTAFVGPAVVAWPATVEVDAEGTFELAALEVAPGVPTRWVRRQAGEAAAGFPKVRVHTPQEFAQLNTGVADTVLRVVGVLLVGSMGIGFLGLASTLALSTLERRRELVMLRAVGASRPQIRALVGVESAVIGAIAAVCGLGVGTALGWAGSLAAPEDLVDRPVLPWVGLVLVGLAAVGVSWLVSLGVARRAAMVPPAEAGRTE